LEKTSQHYPDVLTLNTTTFGVCARIYFRTNGYELRTDDRGALYRALFQMRGFLVRGCGIEVKCRAYADVRGDTNPNDDLSAKRLVRVEGMLRTGLRHLKWCKIDRGEAHGERRSHDSPALWAHDRRVDVLARVETEAEREGRKNPWVKTRAEIFRRYSPIYHLWPKDLDYLIDEYEQNDQEAYPVRVKGDDVEKVYDLSLKITDRSEQGLLINWAKSGSRAEVISDWYCVEYRKAYNIAYDRYRRSTEYGSLSPK
jgi:hypothetical protein